MEVTIISTFDIDVGRLITHLDMETVNRICREQILRKQLLSAFEETLKIGFQDNQFVRLVFSIIDESKNKK